MLSMAIATMFLAILIGGKQITPDNHDQFILAVRLAFATYCLLCLTGIYSSLARGTIRSGPER